MLESDSQINENCYQIDIQQWGVPRVGTVYVVKGEKIFLVDSGTSQTTEKVLKTLEEFKINPKTINTMIITHEHYDHGAGAAVLLKKMPTTMVLASEKTAEILRDPSMFEETSKKYYGEAAGLVSPYPPVKNVEVIEEGDSIDLGGEITLEVVALPGHTPGSIGLFESKTKTFFAGDAVCNYNQQYEFYMPPSFPELFDYETYLKSLDKILSYDLKYLCMGHFGTQKQPKAKQVVKKAAETAKDWKKIISDVYRKTKSEEQVYNKLLEKYGDNEYVKNFPELIRKSVLGQLIKGYIISLKL
nr:MBL fold metallo-hydrolase [Candidatus Freyarchaeota archaeon]